MDVPYVSYNLNLQGQGRLQTTRSAWTGYVQVFQEQAILLAELGIIEGDHCYVPHFLGSLKGWMWRRVISTWQAATIP